MTCLRSGFVLAAALAASLSIAAADQLPSSNQPASGLKFFNTSIPTVQAAVGYGDLRKGPHGTFVKLPAGFVGIPHTHTADYWAVIISGVVANGVPNAADVPLPQGSYFAQRGKEVHVTKCLSTTECVMFISQSGAFDFVPAPK